MNPLASLLCLIFAFLALIHAEPAAMEQQEAAEDAMDAEMIGQDERFFPRRHFDPRFHPRFNPRFHRGPRFGRPWGPRRW